jgi:hypothetical protein
MKIIFLLLLSFCTAIGYSNTFEENDIKNDDSSGVYEGEIEFSMCCDSYDYGNGWIAFDFSQSPPIVLYDGVFREFETSSEYYSIEFGIFTTQNGVYGFKLKSESEYEPNNKMFLKKTSDIRKAKELIRKYKEEKNRFEAFWEKFKTVIINKDFKKLSSFAQYPVKDNSMLIEKYKLSETINTTDELISRFKLIFDKDFYKRIENKWDVFRHENHYPGFEGTYMYMPNVFIIFEKLGDEFKLTQIVGPWG